jgi:hypothetical protein
MKLEDYNHLQGTYPPHSTGTEKNPGFLPVHRG